MLALRFGGNLTFTGAEGNMHGWRWQKGPHPPGALLTTMHYWCIRWHACMHTHSQTHANIHTPTHPQSSPHSWHTACVPLAQNHKTTTWTMSPSVTVSPNVIRLRWGTPETRKKWHHMAISAPLLCVCVHTPVYIHKTETLQQHKIPHPLPNCYLHTLYIRI